MLAGMRRNDRREADESAQHLPWVAVQLSKL